MARFATQYERMSCATDQRLRFLPFGQLTALTFLVLGAGIGQAFGQSEDDVVDVELVLAVDVSWSMDFEEQLIQREGYAGAFQSEEVIEAILYGGYGRVAVTYMEWAGMGSQEVVVPWTLIDSAEAAQAFAAELASGTPRHFRRTSISGAIDFAAALFDDSPYDGIRKVIDISGDGPNNQGGPVAMARDRAVEAGITINGLPLMTNAPGQGLGYAIPDLDQYFAECVIGGGLAFMIPVTTWQEFPMAVRRKLVLELAGELPEEEHLRAAGPAFPDEARVIRAQAAPVEPELSSSDCLVGEKIWERRRMMWGTPPP
jgi:hypothetical protein